MKNLNFVYIKRGSGKIEAGRKIKFPTPQILHSLFPYLLLFGLFISNALKADDELPASGVNFYQGSYEQARAEAKNQRRILFIEFYANWCPHCQKMFRTVLNQDEVGQFYNEHFVNLKVEESAKGARQLMSKFKVSGFPSFVYMDPGTGEILHKTSGEMPTSRFISEGQTALNPENQVEPLIEKFETGDRSIGLLQALLERPRVERSIKIEAYQALVPHLNIDSLLVPRNWALVEQYMQDADEEPFSLIMEQRRELELAYGKDKVSKFLETKAVALASNASLNSKPEQLDRSIAILQKVNTPASKEKALRVELNYYNNHDAWNEYFSVGEKLIKKYSASDWNDMNDIAWNVALHSDEPALLRKAEKWSKKSMSLNHCFSSVETVAMVEYRLKNNKEAEKYALEAIELGKQTHHDFSRTQDLLVKIRQGLTSN